MLQNLPILNLFYTKYGSRTKLTALIVTVLALFGLNLSQQVSRLNYVENIKARGELTVISRNAPTTYFEGNDGPAGFEYELLKAFAEHLGVQLHIETEKDLNHITPLLLGKSADLAAAGLTSRIKNTHKLNLGPSYATSKVQLVYKKGNVNWPKNFTSIGTTPIAILDGYNHEALLKKYKLTHPRLKWKIIKNTNIDELLERLNNNEFTYALVESRELNVSRRYTPEIQVGFTLNDTSSSISWKIAQHKDDSLKKALNDFFQKPTTDQLIQNLQERYFGYIDEFDYVDKRNFLRMIDKRLPLYKPYFKIAEAKTGIDWRLLAAMGYQESHWLPDATSPTGVRGIMMLTNNTAKEMGVTNRLNPKDSIMGGALYLKSLMDRVPKDLENPDRLWVAIAAYNVGFGHILDARALAKRKNLDPSLWLNIKLTLPLLSHKKYYTTLPHGYARGNEPVNYVNNIRDFYDTLIKYEPSTSSPNVDSNHEQDNLLLPTPFGV